MHEDHNAHPPFSLQPREGTLLQRLISPLNIAAYITWTAICSAVVEVDTLRSGDVREWFGTAALLAFIVLFVIKAMRSPRADARWDALNAMAQGIFIVLADALLRSGQTSILLIVVAGQLVLMLPMRRALLYLFAVNVAVAAVWFSRAGSIGLTLQWMLQMIAFQAFAALTGYYAGTRERAREYLAQINAELLATRRLLEESARSGERLKLSRELHDVAGHTLTALKLNLARLARDPALAKREELQVSAALADELLGQIRQVVSTLRAHDGLDLGAALEALAHQVPGVRIAIDVEPTLRVDDIEQAQTLLRCAQEAITNALRHGRAGAIRLSLRRGDGALLLTVDNDGASPTRIDFGNGLTGMRERLDAVGGTLELTPTPPRGLRLVARMPLDIATEHLA